MIDRGQQLHIRTVRVTRRLSVVDQEDHHSLEDGDGGEITQAVAIQ